MDGWPQHAETLIRAGALLMVVVMAAFTFIYNFSDINEFIGRQLERDPNKISIGPAFLIEMTPSERTSQSEIEGLAGYQAFNSPLTVEAVAFDEKGGGVEYVHVRAERPVNLSLGFIGDSDDLFQIPRSKSSNLKSGEELFIYTCVVDRKAPDWKPHMAESVERFVSRYESGIAVLATLYVDPKKRGSTKKEFLLRLSQ